MAPVGSLDDVKAVVAALLRVNKIANATHNIMAYRIYAPEKQTFMQVQCALRTVTCQSYRSLQGWCTSPSRRMLLVRLPHCGSTLPAAS